MINPVSHDLKKKICVFAVATAKMVSMLIQVTPTVASAVLKTEEKDGTE